MTTLVQPSERSVPVGVSSLLSALPMPAALLDEAGTVLSANAGAVAVFGADVVGARLVSRLIDPATNDPVASLALVAVQAGLGGSLPWRDGRVSFHEWKGSGGLVLALFASSSAAGEGEALTRAREVASSVKHEINNLLMGLLGLSALLKLRPELSDASRRKAEQIEEQGRKIRDSVALLDEIKVARR